MSATVNTYILKEIDSDQTNLFASTLKYISLANNMLNNIQIIDNLNIELNKNDFLIILIDELLLEQFLNNSINNEFFIKRNFNTNQIILILDEIDTKQLPKQLIHYQTFTTSNSTGSSTDDRNWDNLDSSTYNITEIINDIVQHINKIVLGINNKRLTVYLGPTDDNTSVEYQKITRELLYRDYNILPEISNPSAKELIDNKKYLLDMIKSADLTIHFIGHKSILSYSENKSPALLINNITADYCKKSEGANLQRIIYVPSEKNLLDDQLNQKIQQFKSDTQILFNAELVQTSIEKFKEIVLNKLEEIANPHKIQTKIDDSTSVYFIYPPGADNDIQSYIKWFDNNNITYTKSQIDLDQIELLSYHKKQLTTCDSVIIYNSGNNEWLNRKLSDIKKSPGWGRQKPFKLKVICGLKSNKPSFNTEINDSFYIIDNCDKLDNNQIKELLTE